MSYKKAADGFGTAGDPGRNGQGNTRRAGRSTLPGRRAEAELLERRWMLSASHHPKIPAALPKPMPRPVPVVRLAPGTLVPIGAQAAPASPFGQAGQGPSLMSRVSTTDELPTFGIVQNAAAANPPLPGLPVLNSLPGAPTAIYLDFNGNGSNAPYDEDGDATSFNAAEQQHITEAWRQLSIYFAPFDVNVTTVKPTVPFVWSLNSNSNSISGGYSYVGVFPNSAPESFNEASDTRSRQSGIAHEVGHNFGLSHQSDYDLLGNKVNEYSSGFDSTHGPIMGVDFAQAVHKWILGHNSNSPSTLQDDLSVISGRIAAQPNGGDGYRPDDYGNTIAAATALTASGGVQTATGIIERMTDADAFSFTDDGSRMSLDVNPAAPSALAPRVEVYDAAGNLLAARDDTSQRGTPNNDVSVPLNLPAGTYYAIVRSHGSYGDVGQYTVTADDLPGGWSSQWVGNSSLAGSARYDAPGGTFTVAGGGADVWGTGDQLQYGYTTLGGDGTIIARVASMQNTDNNAKAGLDIRESLAGNARHAAMVATSAAGPQFLYRTSTAGSTSAGSSPAAAFSPVYVKLARSGNTFTGYRSADGVTWTTVGSATIAMGTNAYIGLITCAHTNTAVNTATFDHVTTSGNVNASPTLNALPAPAGPTAAPGTGTALTVSWSAVAGATGYSVERSIDGTDFNAVGSTSGAAATSYTDAGLWGSMRYFYRVRALDPTGQSTPSAVATATDRPNAPANLSVTSWQTDKVILNWRDVSGETGYRIERSTDGVNFTPLASVGVNVPSYTDTGLTVGTAYSYRLFATSSQGDSPASATAAGSTRLPAPTGLAFTSVTAGQIGIHWSPVPGATGYRIDRSTDGSTFTAYATPGAGATTYSDTSVSPSGRYYYRVVGTTSLTESVWPAPLFAAAPAAVAPPAPWQSQDVGAPAGVGTTGYSAGTFNLIANGNDIWNTADQFRFTSMALVGDGQIVARVATLENTDPWAKAGVMIRETLAGNSKDVFTADSAANGVQFQDRAATAGSAAAPSTVAGKAAPYWVKLVRAGDVFTGYTSPDNVTWTQLGTATVPMASRVYVGLALTSHTTTTLNSSTFDNVTVTTAAPTAQSTVVGDGTAQRSMVTSLTVNFDRPVASFDAGAFALSQRGAGGPTPVTASGTVLPDGSGIVLTFSGAGVTAGSLADGVYDLLVHPSLVRDAAGQAAAGADQTYTFHRLYGDVDGDKNVTNLDYAAFRNAYGSVNRGAGYNAALDADGDGNITNLDYAAFRGRYGTGLAY